ncbi:monocarboxylate transporter 4-like [Mizuhopecten yessoensis]|nr:monocarboxylate transporter 4-like [Mizuhopecten yessoensis]XP_021374583.1 monocarboxylate transporter 4-like [Mizuhopecten yessoensis]XP_021374584.1 monocarboxylate transporter 4-like [Mizuhopecten yessoensis]XP_021374585.1 monocarboxylate transporter 4-like [Mizuhopecten yessoensis]
MRERRLSVADKGWSWAVMAGSFGAHMVSGCFLYAVGVIHNAILERFDEEVGKTAWAAGLFLGMLSLTGVLASALINRYSCRVTMIIGAIIMSSGFAVCAVVPSLDLVILFFGGIGGIGGGLTYSASVVVLGFNFHYKRNIASGIAVSGCGVGVFVLAPVVEAAREAYGNRGFFFIIAGIALHHALFGCLFFPSKLESERKQIRHQKSLSKKSKNRFYILKTILHSFAILKQLSLLCFCLSMFFACVGIYLVYVHFPRYVIEMGSSPLNASFLMAIGGLCNCISRVLVGMAANSESINENVMYFGTFGLLGLSTLLFPLYAFTYGGQLAYAIFLGLYSGCCYSIINTLIIQLVGIEELATGFGICMFFCGIGSIIGPPLAGAIVDNGGSYENSFILAGFCITIAAVLGLAVSCFNKTGESFTHDNQEITVDTSDDMLVGNCDTAKNVLGESFIEKPPVIIVTTTDYVNSTESEEVNGFLLGQQKT